MDVADAGLDRHGLDGRAGLLAALGGGVAVLGTYWDDSWHTDRGRDAFAIPPHLTLYGGVLVSALVLLGWGLLAWRREGWGLGGARRVLGHRPLLLAGVGGAAVLAAGPIDNVWHVRYGRDAVLWSPPHMLAVAASVALSVGLLAGLRTSPGRAGAAARALAGAGVLAALLVPVLEYDSDVPQFSPALYLPVATAGTLLALLVLRGLSSGPWPATVAAGVATVLRVATVLVLAGLHMTLTVIPPVLVPAVVDDLLARRGTGDTARGLVLALVVPASWLPALALQPTTATQVPVGLLPQTVVGCLLAAVTVLALTGRLRLHRGAGRLAVPALLALTLLLPVAAARPALAHDPGQGAPVGSAQLATTRRDGNVRLTALVDRACPRPGDAAARVVGRRAGATVRAGAVPTPSDSGTCSYTGELPLRAGGRWFVYLQLGDGPGRTLETWLELPAGATGARAAKALYVATPPASSRGQALLGGALYLVVIGLLAGSVRLATGVRRRRRQHGEDVSTARM